MIECAVYSELWMAWRYSTATTFKAIFALTHNTYRTNGRFWLEVVGDGVTF